MTRPTLYLLRMLVFLALALGVAALLLPTLELAFQNNPVLNSLILAVLLFGIAWNLRQVMRLSPEVTWVETFRTQRPRLSTLPMPRLLAPMANMLAARRAKGYEGTSERFSLSPQAMRSILDSIASRLDESRELSRYMIGLLIFLGLLGTFWGLLHTVGAVGDVIGGMQVGANADVAALFDQLKTGLQKPLHGMGMAFSASMFGLAGSLILGFLDLTAGQAQNRFFNELEEWLASLTRLGIGTLSSESEGGVPLYVQSLLEQTAENLEQLQRLLARGEEGRGLINQALQTLAEKVSVLSDTMRTHQQLMLRIAETQAALAPTLQRLADLRFDVGDDVSRAHLRNIELTLQRLASEIEQGRAQSTSEIRSDIRLLTRTIAALAEEPQSRS
jgi:uncharacterized protein YukE